MTGSKLPHRTMPAQTHDCAIQRSSFPGYDLLDKRSSPSWDSLTRAVIDERLRLGRKPRWANDDQWRCLNALAARIVPPPRHRAPTHAAAILDRRLSRNEADGYRHERMPSFRHAWSIGLAALDAHACEAHGAAFADLDGSSQDELIEAMAQGRLRHPAWQSMRSDAFFHRRVLTDLVTAHYAHPSAWSEIGFGGPASPRGYVRLGANQTDPWEAREAPATTDAGDERSTLRRARRA